MHVGGHVHSDRVIILIYDIYFSMHVGDHAHSDKVYFYQTGLFGRNYINEKGWKMKTFSKIISELGHTDVSMKSVFDTGCGNQRIQEKVRGGECSCKS